MKKQTTLKAFALSLAMAVGMLLPTTTNAQSDGFFRGGNDIYEDRDNGIGLGEAEQDNPTPVGSGLLVLSALGAGYVALKRKRSRSLLLVCALLLTFTQCKKKETANVVDNGVFITLNAGYGNSKTGFIPGEGNANGTFVWTAEVTEYIYVGGSEHSDCLGVLSGTGTGTGSMTFTGTLITTPNENETLHFFYLGKGGEKTGDNRTNLDFSTQDGTLANVTDYHIAVGDGSYTSGTISYATTLELAMSIAYFDVNGFKNAKNTGETVYMHGDDVYSTATVNFRNGVIEGATKGFINVGTASSGKYVALIPSVDSKTTIKFDSNSKTGEITFNRGIQKGKYYANSGNALSVGANTLLEGTTPGLLSVSATKMIRFSKGNVQATTENNGATWTWSIAENQYDFIGNASSNTDITGNGTVSVNGTVDLFGWSTSATVFGINNSTNNGDYSGDFVDWGTNIGSIWRTPTKDEWEYVCTNSDRSNKRYLKAIISVGRSSYHGVILFPDDYTGSGLSGSYTYNYYAEQSVNANDWSVMEDAGAVFLPNVKRRNGTTVEGFDSNGYYWSSTPYNLNAYHLAVSSGSSGLLTVTNGTRYLGYSVRLVYNVE